MGAVLGLLGITFPSQHAVIDVWPSPVQDSKKGIALSSASDEIQLIGFQSLDHYVKWSILKRVLRTCTPGSIAHDTGMAIADIRDTSFADRRNGVLYQARKWLHKDLFQPTSVDEFGRSESRAELFDSLRQQDENFSISLMLALLNLGHQMASTIGALSGTVAAELKLVEPHSKEVSTLWAECGIAN
jgi:hypothetical protein